MRRTNSDENDQDKEEENIHLHSATLLNVVGQLVDDRLPLRPTSEAFRIDRDAPLTDDLHLHCLPIHVGHCLCKCATLCHVLDA